MTPAQAIDIGRSAIWMVMMVGGPIMVAALIVGLAISLVQALTQIQEMTLSFVPKIIVMFVAMMLLLPFMLTTLTSFTERLFDTIVGLGL